MFTCYFCKDQTTRWKEEQWRAIPAHIKPRRKGKYIYVCRLCAYDFNQIQPTQPSPYWLGIVPWISITYKEVKLP